MSINTLSTNFLQSNSYQLLLPRFPEIQYFATDFVLPEVTLPPAYASTPYTDLKFAGDKPVFSNMTFNFLVDEQMNNYQEILDWINGIGFSSSYSDYTNYPDKGSKYEVLGEQDVKVVVLSSKSNPIRTLNFYDAIPVSLSGLQMTSQDSGTNYVKASLVMAYTRFDFDTSMSSSNDS